MPWLSKRHEHAATDAGAATRDATRRGRCAMSVRGHCILSHGFESGPDATKVTALAEVAERLGWRHERPDYTDLDAQRHVGELGDVAARRMVVRLPEWDGEDIR